MSKYSEKVKYPWQENPAAFYGAVALIVAVLAVVGVSMSGVFHSMHLW
jgi:hypothetical protein